MPTTAAFGLQQAHINSYKFFYTLHMQGFGIALLKPPLYVRFFIEEPSACDMHRHQLIKFPCSSDA